MLGGIGWGDAGEALDGRVAKLSTRCGENELLEVLLRVPLDTLKDGVVLAVGRQ